MDSPGITVGTYKPNYSGGWDRNTDCA
jgi:hypothetical protein